MRVIATPGLARAGLVAAVALLLGAAPSASGHPIASADAPRTGVNAASPAKGPIGWDSYRQVSAMAQLRPGTQSRQFSSFDRTGGNDDGFNGTYSCLRQSADGCVIAERAGAGEISSIWFTRDYGDVTKTGVIKIELDGRTVLSAPLQSVVNGSIGAPFVWPLVGNGSDTAGGAVIKVPMPYRESMRVTVAQNPLFYHVTYREFVDADGVRTFDPADRAQDVVDRLRMFGVADPKPVAAGRKVTSNASDVANGTSRSFAQLTGPGQITQVRVRLPQVARSPRVGDDGRAYKVGGGSTFTVAVAPDNQGVRLTMRFDPVVGHQQARVLVDGKLAGQWSGGDPQAAGGWAEQSIEVPAALTTGKSRLRISNEFVASDLDVNEFRYDVHSRVGTDWVRSDVLDVGPNHPGEEQAHGYTITAENWSGTRVYRYPVSADQVTSSNVVLANTRLRITFDGRTTVDSPIGEFFGSGLGRYDTRSLMSSIDATSGGWFTAWWPMPYGQSVAVELVNNSGVAITGATVEVTSAPDPSVAAKLGVGGSLAYFNATSHAGAVTAGQDWNFVDTTGRGVFYGVTHSMRGAIATGNRREHLEGDERVYVDGAASPTLHGTGTEDFYESGWYFRDGTTYVMPMAGNPAYALDGDGCKYDCTGAYRLMIADAVSFNTSLTFGIEHGPVNQTPADYSSTAYWYGKPELALRNSDVVEPADAANRAAHTYQAAGETRSTVQSTFEGGRSAGFTRDTTASTGPVTFTTVVAANNAGVRLVRLSDQQVGYQKAAVYVDNQLAGTWSQPLANRWSRWLEDTFELPAALTAGKTTVSVRIEPAAGAPVWSASRYRALSHIAGFLDHTSASEPSGCCHG